MKRSKALLLALLAVLLCLTISCSITVSTCKEPSPASPEEGTASGGKAVDSGRNVMASQSPGSYRLTGPCEKVFIEHPRQELTVTGGKGTFYSPQDAESGISVQTGFNTIVEQNVGYKFVVAEGDTLTFTATAQL